MKRYGVLATMALMVCACVPFFGGDGRLEVSGRVSDTNGKLFEKCRLELLDSDDGKSLSQFTRWDVPGEFTISSTGPPYRALYIVDVSCQGARTSFRSAPIKIGGTPTQLGQITLERR